MSSPKVSVLMPVYNAESYLKEAIDSILSQTFTDFEFIIINDGSTDRSEEIILSYKDERIHYIKNKQNLKIAESLNKGIRLCNGEYIARMDADDIAKPERLYVQVTFMDANSDIGACGSAVKTFGALDESWVMPTNHEAICSALALHSCLLHPTVIIRSSTLNKLGSKIYQDEYLLAEDYDLWSRLSHKTRLHNLPQELLFYRVVEGRDTYKEKQALVAMNVRFNYLNSLGVVLSEATSTNFQRYFSNQLSFSQQKNLFDDLITAMTSAGVAFGGAFEELLTNRLYTSMCSEKRQSYQSKLEFFRFTLCRTSVALKLYFSFKLLLRVLVYGR